jgi:hypothetical protein
MTYSQNFEVVMQIFGRVLRKSPNIPMKYFFKVAPKNTAGYFVVWMNAMFMLFDEEGFSTYNGKNGFDIRIPNALIKGTPKAKSSNGGGKSTKGKIKPRNIEFFNSLSFMKENGWFKMEDTLATVASTTLREVCVEFGFVKQKYVDDYLKNVTKKFNTIYEFSQKHPDLYEVIQEKNLQNESFNHMVDYMNIPNTKDLLIKYIKENNITQNHKLYKAVHSKFMTL